jgi:flagellar biosynthesis/type III secretory pathway chaperone
MIAHDKFTENVLDLENLMVRQLRSLQQLVDLSRQEREALLKHNDRLMSITEDKEALLDQLSLMEDARRKLVQEIAILLELKSSTTSIAELVPHFKKEESIRINRLAEGINSLAVQAKEMSHANQALICTRLEWLQAAQSFLISMAQPNPGYRPPVAPASVDSSVWGLEFRA